MADEASVLIRDATIVTVDSDDTVIEHGAVLVDDAGRLAEVRPVRQGDDKLVGETTALYNDGEPFCERLKDASWNLGVLNSLKCGITTFNSMDTTPHLGAPR